MPCSALQRRPQRLCAFCVLFSPPLQRHTATHVYIQLMPRQTAVPFPCNGRLTMFYAMPHRCLAPTPGWRASSMMLLVALAASAPQLTSSLEIVSYARNVSVTVSNAPVTYSSPYCSCASPEAVPLKNGSKTVIAAQPATLSRVRRSQTCSSLPLVRPGGDCGASIGICTPVRRATPGGSIVQGAMSLQHLPSSSGKS